MKTIYLDKSDKKLNCWPVKFLVFLCCISFSDFAPAETCLLATQLKDPYIRAEYEAIIAANQTINMNLSVEGMYGNIQTASYSSIPEFSNHKTISLPDPVSMECITCHDGTMAKSVNNKTSTGKSHRENTIESIIGSHPIGMDYEKYRGDREYVPREILPADMVLMNGKVGCVTCHNLLSSNRLYLAVDNSRSGLCFSCHDK